MKTVLIFCLLLSISLEAHSFESDMPSSIHLDSNDLYKLSIQEFLELLLSRPDGHIFIKGATIGWPDIKSVKYLKNLLGNKASCMSVSSYSSSSLGSRPSDIDREVRFLLLGIKEKSYPPRLNSFNVTQKEYEEIESWIKTLSK